jgi:hypothetical protein
MSGNRRMWMAALVLLAALAVPALTVPAQRAAAQQAQTFTFPAGQVCAFQLTVTAEGGSGMTRQVDGRTIFAGTGSNLTFTNDQSGKSVTYKSRGSADQFIPNPDGTTTEKLQGWNAVLLFPTDNGGSGLNPPGAYLIVGSAVINVSPAGVFTVQSVSGQVTNVCAALS